MTDGARQWIGRVGKLLQSSAPTPGPRERAQLRIKFGNMIPVDGAHGAGKSRSCSEVDRRLGVETFTGSALIAERTRVGFSNDKPVSEIDIGDDQLHMLTAAHGLSAINRDFLIDGHS